MKINRLNLARIYARSYGISISKAKKRLNEVADVIVSQLALGNDVMLDNFFNFRIRNREAKKAINLQTGKPTIIPATKTVVAQMAAPTKRKIQGK